MCNVSHPPPHTGFNWMESVVSGPAKRIFDARDLSFSFSKQYRHDLGDWTTNWQLNIYGLLFCFGSCLSCSACTEARREKPRDWLFHREVLWNVPELCLCYVPLRFSLSVLTWIEHLEDNPASGSCNLYNSSYVSSAYLFKVLGWEIMSQDQRRGGQKEKVALCLFWITVPLLFLYPLGQFWGCQTQWRTCAPTSPSWKAWWRKSTTWLSQGPGTQRCPTSLRSFCPCSATTCPTGGSGGPSTCPPVQGPGAPRSRLNTSVSSWATFWKSSTTTWASTRPLGWSALQVPRMSFSPGIEMPRLFFFS